MSDVEILCEALSVMCKIDAAISFPVVDVPKENVIPRWIWRKGKRVNDRIELFCSDCHLVFVTEDFTLPPGICPSCRRRKYKVSAQ